MTDVTRILAAIEGGDSQATEVLLPIVYDELRRIAAAKLRQETPGHTLQTTALVHEAYLRLVGEPVSESTADAESGSALQEDAAGGPSWQSRGHFFAAAAEAMRRILIDSSRRKRRLKRGGGRQRLDLERVPLAAATPEVDLLALDEALDKLQRVDELKANIVKFRYFAGLTIEQTAAALDISPATVKRHWYYARAWLRREMQS